MATGHKGAFTLGSVTHGLNVISIKPPKPAVGALALPHLGLAVGDNMPYEALELVEGGEYELVLADDNNTQLVHAAQSGSGATFKKLIGLAQTMTWTKPPAAGLTNGATRAFSGFVMEAGEDDQQTGQRNTITVKIKVAGNLTLTAGS
jgi:hypothetical protein